MIHGSCLCGDVTWEIDGIHLMTTCHCTTCRKATGAAFATWAHVAADKLRILTGEDLVVYSTERTVQGPHREFCRSCGSKVPAIPRHMETWSVPAGALDEDPGVGLALHVFTSERAPWWEIRDELPQFEKWVPGFEPKK